MANVQQVNYTRIDNEDEGNKKETTASGQETTVSPSQQQAATDPQPVIAPQHPAMVPQPVIVPQQPIMMAAPPPAGVQYMPQVGAVQYMPQVGAVQYMPQVGTVQFIPQPVQPLTQGAVPHVKLLPNDYLAVTLVLTFFCAILNITSLFLGIPALIFSIIAYNAKGTGKYMQAKTYGNVAMGLNIANIVYTLVADTLIVGLTIGIHCSGRYVRYPYYRYYGC